jgi:hypothetical protein
LLAKPAPSASVYRLADETSAGAAATFLGAEPLSVIARANTFRVGRPQFERSTLLGSVQAVMRRGPIFLRMVLTAKRNSSVAATKYTKS